MKNKKRRRSKKKYLKKVIQISSFHQTNICVSDLIWMYMLQYGHEYVLCTEHRHSYTCMNIMCERTATMKTHIEKRQWNLRREKQRQKKWYRTKIKQKQKLQYTYLYGNEREVNVLYIRRHECVCNDCIVNGIILYRMPNEQGTTRNN